MVEDASQEYAVPRYRDPERAARIVQARRRGELYKDIAAREGVSRQRIQQICRYAGLTVRRPTTPPPHPCAWTECGKLLRDSSAIYCSQKCAVAADPFGKHFYERRRDTGATWREIVDAAAPDSRPGLRPAKRTDEARRLARRYAKVHGLPWPLPDRATSERMARRDEEGMAEIREMVERERRVLALLDELPKDRTISRDEADRFLVELYRAGMKYSHIAKRTNCSVAYVAKVVRRRAPELARPREPRGKKAPPLGPLLDLRELRKAWNVERRMRGRDQQDARMLAAYLAGDSLLDISRRENIHRDMVWKRISAAASPELLPRPPLVARRT